MTPITVKRYCYLSVIIDRASRWIECFPMRDDTAEFLLVAFLLFLWRRGCPRIMYSGRSGKLLSFLACKVYQRLGVTKVSSSAHRHNGSSLCERSMQSLLTTSNIIFLGSSAYLLFFEVFALLLSLRRVLAPSFWSIRAWARAPRRSEPSHGHHGP